MESEKKEDFLDVDPPIPGQNYTCISFISPENMILEKDKFIMKEFAKNFISKGLSIDKFDEEYESFSFNDRDKYEEEFNKNNDHKTSIRGVKIRGVYESYREAEVRAQVLQKLNNSHNVFVGQVGYWLPWDPNADKIENQEYANEELNDLMKSYKENQSMKDQHYKEQVSERTKSAESVEDSLGDSMQKDDPWVEKNL